MKQILILLACIITIGQDLKAENYFGPTNIEKADLTDATFTGPTKLKEVTAKSLIVTGPFEFHSLKVEKKAEITGPVTASENGNFESLEVTGPFTAQDINCATFRAVGPIEMTNFNISGETNIIGSLTAKKGHFHNLIINADETFLEDVEVNDILVKKENKKQSLHLLGKTIIKGDISFESGEGIINKDPGVMIQGKVKGATLEYNEKK